MPIPLASALSKATLSASLNGEGMISALLKNTGESAGTYVKVMVVDSAAKLTPYGNAVTVNSAE